MHYSFEFRPYQRRFRQPLKTHHGIWEIREGIILRLTDETGRVGYGEIAPLPWFGSETLALALAFCEQLKGKLTEPKIQEIPEDLPACQFGFESALESLFRAEGERGRLSFSYLLPAGEAALQAWEIPQSATTFKWKIGAIAIAEEIKIFEKLVRTLPAGAKLRLDANGGLGIEEAKAWLEVADKTQIVEFIEQPLSPQEFDLMLDLGANYSTAIALDESVATLQQLEDCYQKGWRGIYIIKAAIAGSPQRLRQFCRQHKIDAVFSSVFETKIGREAGLHLAAELSNPNRAIGFGVGHWFEEDDGF
jgi:O-succinylbenzoate synthase